MAKLSGARLRHAGWSRAGAAWVAAAVLLLWFSGVALYAWPAEGTFELAPWQLWLRRSALVVHGCTVWLLLVVAGRWVGAHLGAVWHRHRNTTWVLGVTSGVLLLVVASTGLLLLYGPEAVRTAASAVHWWTAVLVPLLLAMHGRGWLFRT